MKTIILMWNPEISNVSVTAFRMGMKVLAEDGMSWEVYAHDRVEVGDICYLIRCDKPTGGIVARGIVKSEPEKGEHWYREGRHTWYCEIAVTHIFNPVTAPLITVEQLQKEIPGFQWDGGHSGRILRAGWAKRLEQLWDSYLQNTTELFKGRNGIDYTKEVDEYTVLEATLFQNVNTDIWLYIDRDAVTVTRVYNIDIPDDQPEDIVTLDGREVTHDLTFSIMDAYKVFGTQNRFELYKILTRDYSNEGAQKFLMELLYDNGVKFDYEKIDDWDDVENDEDEKENDDE